VLSTTKDELAYLDNPRISSLPPSLPSPPYPSPDPDDALRLFNHGPALKSPSSRRTLHLAQPPRKLSPAYRLPTYPPGSSLCCDLVNSCTINTPVSLYSKKRSACAFRTPHFPIFLVVPSLSFFLSIFNTGFSWWFGLSSAGGYNWCRLVCYIVKNLR